MMQLNRPNNTMGESVRACLAGIIRLNDLREKLAAAESNLENACNNYVAQARLGELFKISPIDDYCKDPKVVQDLTKSDLIKIYEQFFVPEDKPARKIYDAILNSSNEECPFCGGIGTPKNLDHFLPKSHFPQFSISPDNLIPSCLDCNLDEKKNSTHPIQKSR